MNSIKIPVYQPDLGGNEKRYVNECLDTAWISSRGRFVGEFEARFAERIGSAHAASVCNGTVALHLALLALGIGPGDEVIVPTLTYIASVNAIAYTGAKPVFVDSDRATWQMDVQDVERHITPATRAIMAVHLYGQACDLPALRALADQQHLFLVEDCAEAFGTLHGARHAGTFGDISTFSFFGNKTITTGEGGMVVTDDKTLAERARHYKGQGLAAHREYWHDVIGYNYRMTNIEAAIGLAQIERADYFLAQKQRVAARYADACQDLPLEFHAEQAGTRHSHWMISALVPRPEQREPLRATLAAAGIETRPLFYPVHTMPMYAGQFRRHPVAEDLAWRGINLPSFPGLSDAQIDGIAGVMRDYFADHG
ncbi:MAG: DegT/DnrJ/EryC1/StrS aminotransferase family protein [Burkholderiaceae bacterium]|nr:DegT/DnrJ/EryC1/StrS aminotransferase family protein [Burkholderiaceae bacterium]